MSISVQCPGCEKKLKAKDELAGKKVKCPSCGQVIVVPDVRSASQAKTVGERVIFHLSAGQGTLETGDEYVCMSITNRRILVYKLGSHFARNFIGVILGGAIGGAIAEKTGQDRTRKIGESLRRADLSKLDDIDYDILEWLPSDIKKIVLHARWITIYEHDGTAYGIVFYDTTDEDVPRLQRALTQFGKAESGPESDRGLPFTIERHKGNCYVVTATFGKDSPEALLVHTRCRRRFLMNPLLTLGWCVYRYYGPRLARLSSSSSIAHGVCKTLLARPLVRAVGKGLFLPILFMIYLSALSILGMVMLPPLLMIEVAVRMLGGKRIIRKIALPKALEQPSYTTEGSEAHRANDARNRIR